MYGICLIAVRGEEKNEGKEKIVIPTVNFIC
jgi:hypothetical protein